MHNKSNIFFTILQWALCSTLMNHQFDRSVTRGTSNIFLLVIWLL